MSVDVAVGELEESLAIDNDPEAVHVLGQACLHAQLVPLVLQSHWKDRVVILVHALALDDFLKLVYHESGRERLFVVGHLDRHLLSLFADSDDKVGLSIRTSLMKPQMRPLTHFFDPSKLFV